jgi:hypothetical protein
MHAQGDCVNMGAPYYSMQPPTGTGAMEGYPARGFSPSLHLSGGLAVGT